MSLVGARVARVEDRRLVTGRGAYADNLRPPELADAVHVTFVRSPYAHAAVKSVDLDAARRARGVVAVFSAGDIDLEPLRSPFLPDLAGSVAEPYLAAGVVRFVGEPVAALVTRRRDEGADAAELVAVDYEPLLPVV